MRRQDKAITNSKIINQLLQQSQVVRVAFSIDNTPHIVPLSYGYKNNKIYIHSSREGSKIEMIKKNNHVCFEVEQGSEVIKDEIACNWTTKYRSIIGWGNITIIDDDQQKRRGLDIIMQKYGGGDQHDYNSKQVDNMYLLVIEIEKLTGKQSGTWE